MEDVTHKQIYDRLIEVEKRSMTLAGTRLKCATPLQAVVGCVVSVVVAVLRFVTTMPLSEK
jgi:hypothetical protein